MKRKIVIIAIVPIALLIIAAVLLIFFNKTNKIIIWNYIWLYDTDSLADIISKKEEILKNIKSVKTVKYYNQQSLSQYDKNDIALNYELSAFVIETNNKNFNQIIPEEFYANVGLIECFLENDLTDNEKSNIKKEIQRIEKVTLLKYISEEDALNKMKEKYRDKLHLLEGYQDIFPASFILGVPENYIEDKDFMHNIKERLESIKNIKKLVSQNDTIASLISSFKNLELQILRNMEENI